MQYNEMQVGDKVEIADKRTVTISKIDAHANAYDQNGKVIMADGSHGPGSREFGLIERPIPELPTELGSIISVESDNPLEQDHEYVLVSAVLSSTRVWRGINNSNTWDVGYMRKVAVERGGFKVIR
ncbi:hypothetical protein SEA_LYELL_110 [Microbacterium phage Lyell]|nr:hypothetical protein SEA_LYELL_110 [Microbacterium phage Lyell]